MYDYDRRFAARALPLDDNEINGLAQRVLRELPRHLKFKDMTHPLWSTRGFRPDWGYELEGSFKTTNVRGHPVSVTVEVRAKVPSSKWGPRQYVSGGAARGFYQPDSKGGPTGQKLFTRLIVNFNPERTPQELLDRLRGPVLKELLSVLRHEVTHLKDVVLPQKGDQTDPEVYYNEPSEVRAFMRQIVDEVIDYAHEVGQDDPFFLILNTQFVEQALRKSPTWQRVSPVLSKKNERLILQAVYRALRDAWPKLQELYPDEDDF